MKSLIPFFILVSTSAFALPAPGLYQCINGNEPSICDQSLRTIVKNDVLEGISIVYDGDCAGQGPYAYDCQGNLCQDDTGMITFEFKDDSNYRWENKQHDFFCDFKKI